MVVLVVQGVRERTDQGLAVGLEGTSGFGGEGRNSRVLKR